MVTKSSQTALQADNRLPESLSVAGETRIPLIQHGRSLGLEDLVVEILMLIY